MSLTSPGHDTTANSLAYALLMLAAYPEVQDWISEEVQEIVKDENSEIWDYGSLFPRLQRCRAVLVGRKRLHLHYSCRATDLLSLRPSTIPARDGAPKMEQPMPANAQSGEENYIDTSRHHGRSKSLSNAHILVTGAQIRSSGVRLVGSAQHPAATPSVANSWPLGWSKRHYTLQPWVHTFPGPRASKIVPGKGFLKWSS